MKRDEILAVLSLVFPVLPFFLLLAVVYLGFFWDYGDYILSLFFLLPLISIVFGFLGVKKSKGIYRKISLVGIVMSVLSLISGLLLLSPAFCC